MHRRTRRIFFWLAVLIFGAASYAAIAYARGYKYDFAHGTFVRTGALVVAVNTDAELFVNDRSAGSTSLLGHRVGQDRLLPGTYNVRLERTGYSPWRKSAVVQEGLLTEFPTVLLLPTSADSLPVLKIEILQVLKASPSMGPFVLQKGILSRQDGDQITQIAQGVVGMSLTEDSSRILWFTRNELWVLWLNNTDYQPFHSEGDKELVTRLATPIRGAAWFRDRDHIVVDLGNSSYRVLETDLRGGINIIKI